MAQCRRCHAELGDARFCPNCGLAADPRDARRVRRPTQEELQAKAERVLNTEDLTDTFPEREREQQRANAVLAYLFVLIVIPIMQARNVPFVRFHIQQGLALIVTTVVTALVRSVVFEILAFFRIPFFLTIFVHAIFLTVFLGLAALMLFGVANAWQGKARVLPVIGKMHVLP